MARIRGHLTYANVVATLALFLVLSGGAAVAASKLGKGSVGTKQLRNQAVTTAKLRNGAVTGAKVADGAITGAKVDLRTLGTVPSATAANTANRADTAASAGTARSADTARTATSAETARNADALGGIGPDAFTRQASSGTSSVTLLHTSGTAREVTIEAPRDGYLLAIASASVEGLLVGEEATDYYSCFVIFEGSPLPQTERVGQLSKGTQTSEDCATNGTIPVSAGFHNVRFAFSGIGPTTSVYQAELDVVFIPFSA